MPRPFLAALLAIAFLFAGSLASIAWVTGGASGSAVPVSAQAGEPSTPRNSVLPPLRAPTLPGPALASQPSESQPREETPRPDPSARSGSSAAPVPASWPPSPPQRPGPFREGVTPQRRHELVSFRREMIAGLAGLRKRVERCAAADASFTLALETIPGGIRVVDARPEGRGPDADSGVACARSTLLGQIIPAASAVPGRQWQMALSVRSST